MVKPKTAPIPAEGPGHGQMNSRTLSDLRAHSDLWYKVRVLLHDLCNIANDRAAEARTLQTTDELYISAPYFTPDEATVIKSTVVSPPILDEVPEFEAGDDEPDVKTSEQNISTTLELMTIEEAIKSSLKNFFEKRRASGDARPCGPHDMGPIYRAVFGITKEELKDEKFLSRLSRAGLAQPKAEKDEGSGRQRKKGGKKGS